MMISEAANSESASAAGMTQQVSFGPLRSLLECSARFFFVAGAAGGSCLRAKFTQGAKRRVHRVDGFNPVIYRPRHIRLF